MARSRRNPFVWQVQIRREVLDDEVSQLRELPYSLWRDMLEREMVKSAIGRDSRTYRVRVSAAWAAAGSENIRVTVSLESSGALRRGVVRQRFVITPDNQLLD